MRVDPCARLRRAYDRHQKPYQIPRYLRSLAGPTLRASVIIHGSGFDGPVVGSVQHVGDDADAMAEADPASKERRCCFFVRRIVKPRSCSLRLRRPCRANSTAGEKTSRGSNSQLDAVWNHRQQRHGDPTQPAQR